MRPIGIIVVIAALAAPIYWFLPLAAAHDPEALFSQYLGSFALIAMGITQLLATRAPGLERLFGGLDRIYVLHKWLGISAIVAILLHDTIDADMDALGRQTSLMEVAETLGEISLYGLLILGVLTIATWVPYQFWRLTHKFMGAFFILGTFHFIFIGKPFDISDPVGLYVLAFCVIGVLAYLYTLIPFGIAQGRNAYEVADVATHADTVSVTLSAKGRGIPHRAGQFAFVSFDMPGAREVHPFTISAAPTEDRKLCFSIKNLGDYTRLLPALAPGTPALVTRAFGHFSPANSGRRDVWVAAGIGITPFLAFAGSAAAFQRPVDLFYCVRTRASAFGLEELEEAAASNPDLTVHVVASDMQGRLTVDDVSDAIGGDFSGVNVHFCGPKEMRKSLRTDFIARGLRRSAFHHEEFEIRSDLGLRKAAEWVMARAFRRRSRPA